jgi:hypothetical protein
VSASFHLLFFLFYGASSYAITGERTSILIDELRHSRDRHDGSRIDSACRRLSNGFPNFREAKNGGSDSLLVECLAHPLPKVAVFEFQSGAVFKESLLALFKTLARAPPSAFL